MEVETPPQNGTKGYEIVSVSSYAQGVAKLRTLGEQPKTFRENIEAKVIAYENGDKSLLRIWLDSCTGIAYKQKSTQFQIVSPSSELINIPAAFRRSFLPVNYDDIAGIELDSSNGKYNQGLTKDEVLDHPGWLAAVGDKALLKAYHGIIFKEFKKKKAMGFYVRQNTDEDQLRALFVFNLDSNSYAFGYNNLNYNGSFLRGSPVVGACENMNKDSSHQEQRVITLPTRDQILAAARPYVAEPLWTSFVEIVPKEAPVLGDVLQRAADGRYFSPHSWEAFKTKLGK